MSSEGRTQVSDSDYSYDEGSDGRDRDGSDELFRLGTRGNRSEIHERSKSDNSTLPPPRE